MNHKEIVRNILIEEFSKINNINYHFGYPNLLIKVNTKKLVPSLVNQCTYFEAGINSEYRFDYTKNYTKNSRFWLSYNNFWLKFEKETKLKYVEIQQLVKNVLEKGFKLKGITPSTSSLLRRPELEKGFKLKGITPHRLRSPGRQRIEEGFNLKKS
jgi:hypothetical protein